MRLSRTPYRLFALVFAITVLININLPPNYPGVIMTSVKELYGDPKVGGDTLSYCSKCKMELAHVIVSMVGSRPAKVICKTCKGQHNFKSVGAIVPRASRPKGPRKTPAERAVVKVAEVWEKKMGENKSSPMIPYTVKSVFKQGDVIQHPSFGVGFVEEVRKGGKIAVMFKEAERVLVHGIGA